MPDLVKLSKQLYPTGRAWKMPYQGILEGIHKGLAISEQQAYEDALSTLDSALPDNANFTADDASSWERRLGLIVSPAIPLEDRKLAIKRKMNHPGTIPARQNYRYLEGQLQAAGFDVYVYENRFLEDVEVEQTSDPNFTSGGIWYSQANEGGIEQSWTDGTAEILTGVNNGLFTGDVLTIGNSYKIRITFTAAGTIYFWGATPLPSIPSGAGSYEFDVVASNTNMGITIFGTTAILTEFSITEIAPTLTTKSPLELTGGLGGRELQHGDVQHGTNQHGSIFTNVVANYIDESLDEVFGIGNNLRSTFFIGGSPIGTFSDVSTERKEEFRQLILRLKPTQTVAFLFINYI